MSKPVHFTDTHNPLSHLHLISKNVTFMTLLVFDIT